MIRRLQGPVLPVVILAIVIAVLTLISAGDNVFIGNLIVITIIYAALATSWNVVGGLAGQLSLGHAAFFGVGAFTSSILYLNFGISPWLGLIVSMILGGIISLGIGIPTFRLRGPYYALATLALGIILYNTSIYLKDLTGGNVGLSIPADQGLANMIFFERWPYAIIAGGYLILCIAITTWIVSTRLGFQLAAVREDEDAARALGVNGTRVKLIAGTISGALAAGVGTIYAQYLLFITPDSVLGIMVSIEVVVLAVVGGSGRVYGPLLGAALLVPLGQLILRELGGALPGLHLLIYGVVVVIVVLLFPRGIAGLLQQAKLRLVRKVEKA